MTSKERLQTMVRGGAIDRVAVSGWMHMPLVDHNVHDFVKATINLTDYCGFDFIKVMTNGNFMPEAYGADLTPSRDPHEWCCTFHRYPLQSANDVAKIQVLDAKSGSLRREVEAVKMLADHYQGDMPILATIFNPITSIQEMMSCLDPTTVQEMMRTRKEELHTGLKAVSRTIKNYLDELITAGIDGIFLANQYSMASIITPEQYDEFCRPYDIDILKYIEGRTWFNMLHVHGDAGLLFDHCIDYPVEAFNWENVPSGADPSTWTSIAKVRSMTDKILISGIDQEHDFYNRENDRAAIKRVLKKRLEDALKDCPANKFIFAPGCSMPLDVDKYIYTIIREVADEYPL